MFALKKDDNQIGLPPVRTSTFQWSRLLALYRRLCSVKRRGVESASRGFNTEKCRFAASFGADEAQRRKSVSVSKWLEEKWHVHEAGPFSQFDGFWQCGKSFASSTRFVEQRRLLMAEVPARRTRHMVECLYGGSPGY